MMKLLQEKGIESYGIFFKPLLEMRIKESSGITSKQMKSFKHYSDLVQLIEKNAPSSNLATFLIEPCNTKDSELAIVSWY